MKLGEVSELIKRQTAANRLLEPAKLETDKDILQKFMDEYETEYNGK